MGRLNSNDIFMVLGRLRIYLLGLAGYLCQVKHILDLPSFVLFVDSFVYIFNHSDDYAEKFRLALNKNKLQLIRHNTHDLTPGCKSESIGQNPLSMFEKHCIFAPLFYKSI